MTRDELQGIAAHRLAKSRRVVCQWATGTGKTNVALKFLAANPWMNCLILVPEQNNIENWTYEFEKFGVPMLSVQIACYASFHKFKNTKWDLLVFDEAPHVDTDKRKKICETVKADYVLALGAVLADEELSMLESVYGKFEVSKISLSDAIQQGILPPPQVKVVHLQLDDTDLSFRAQGRLCTAKGYYNYLNRKVEEAVTAYNQVSNEFNRRRMLTAGNTRKRFLGSQKQAAIRRLCTELEKHGKRFLCFCSSIQQAEELGGDRAFTSKSAKSLKHLGRFNNHEIDSLFVVGKLIEGQNLRDINCGVIGQIGGTSRITVQQCGRIMRSENPVIYVPIFDGTKDDSFLYTLTSNISKDYIQHYKF